MRGQKQYREAHMLLFTNIATNNIQEVRQASNKHKVQKHFLKLQEKQSLIKSTAKHKDLQDEKQQKQGIIRTPNCLLPRTKNNKNRES
jgi:D-ribose pyranose/furanose isomerase RbsD